MSSKTPDRDAGIHGLPLWIKVVATISLLLFAAWALLIYFTYVERRNGSIAEARGFAESVNQMTLAMLTGTMVTGIAKDRPVFMDQIRNANQINDLKVYPYGPVVSRFGASPGNPSAEEKTVMASGKPYFAVNEDDRSLHAVFPILNSRNYLGKDCMTSCHEGTEGEVLGAVSMRVSLDKVQAELRSFTTWISLLALGLCVPLLGAVYFIVHRWVARPLGGEPAYATEVVQRIARGDLTVEIATRRNDDSSLLANMAQMQKNLRGMVVRIQQTLDAITTASSEIAAGNADLSSRTEEQASSLEETASSMEELTSTVKQNADNAHQANQLAAGASEVAVKGGQVVSEVVTTMSSINDSSKKIADIIGVIDGIAFQTNILALNAA
ncbi:MAG: methyl-accepting chemotaxis protein, partial [Burkholderiales bacterium]